MCLFLTRKVFVHCGKGCDTGSMAVLMLLRVSTATNGAR